jgi:hypothetical protein
MKINLNTLDDDLKNELITHFFEQREYKYIGDFVFIEQEIYLKFLANYKIKQRKNKLKVLKYGIYY